MLLGGFWACMGRGLRGGFSKISNVCGFHFYKVLALSFFGPSQPSLNHFLLGEARGASRSGHLHTKFSLSAQDARMWHFDLFHRALQGVIPRGRQLYFTFPSAPDPLFKVSKAPFLTSRVATPSGAPRQAPLDCCLGRKLHYWSRTSSCYGLRFALSLSL